MYQALKVINMLIYDTEVEYLESNGTQWIDTGISPSLSTVSCIKVMNLASTGDVIYGYRVQ